MRKYLLGMLLCILTGSLWASMHEPQIKIEVDSEEFLSVTGEFTFTLIYSAQDTFPVDDSLDFILPEGWSVKTIGSLSNSTVMPSANVTRSITFEYDEGDLSFYPQKFSVIYGPSDINPTHLKAAAYVYFTPYETIELWSYYDFVHLNRNWYIPESPEPSRVYVDPITIPASNIPSNFAPTEDWEEDFQFVDVPGLAYSIPMLAIHPDTLALDTGNIVIWDTSARYDGCGGTLRRYLGVISGTVVSPFDQDNSTALINRPLQGLRVEIFERDYLFGAPVNFRIGFGTTDASGNFSINVNTCQFNEGGACEIFVRVEAKNYARNIVGKNTWVLGSKQTEDTGIRSWTYNSGSASNVSFGTLVVDNGAHRGVHLANNAWTFANTYACITLDNDLTVRADLSDGSFFLPESYCGIPISAAPLAGTIIPVIGQLIAVFAIPYVAIDLVTDTQKPNLYISELASDHENTVRHEFGHFLMWQLQSKCWTDIASGSFAYHENETESNTRLAWTEGWADAFSMMVDVHNHDWDGESGTGWGYDYEDREEFTAINFGPASEYHIACAIFDLWDGANKVSHWTTPPAAARYDDVNSFSDPDLWRNGTYDQVSLSLCDITQAIKDGDTYAPNDWLESIQGFYKNLIDGRTCEERLLIAEVFDQNRVVGDVSEFPNGDFQGFSADDIAAQQTVNYSATLWSFSFLHEFDQNFLWTSAQDYNLATQTVNGTKFLNDDLVVKDGATLHFNRNIPMGWVAAASADRPATSSTMLGELCGGITIEAIQNGTLLVGDQAVSAYADVHLESGGTLILGGNTTSNNGKLKINNNSRFYVESGATLVIDKGALIELNGSNAILEIDGTLEIRAGATFTYTGAGHVVWGNTGGSGYNIIANTGSTFELLGAGLTDHILRVKANARIHPETDLAAFELDNGYVSMGNNAHINTSDADILLRDLEVLLDGSTGQHLGIQVNGQLQHIIEDIIIHDGVTGITAYQMWNEGAFLNLTRCEIYDCGTALRVLTRGADLFQCDFHDNSTGWRQEMATGLSYAHSSTFNNNDIGIDFISAPGNLYFRESEADDNEYGIIFQGPGTLYGKCGSASDNDEVGVIVGNGGTLTFADQWDAAGSQMKITGNDVSIGLSYAHTMNLSEGRNDLIPIVQGVDKVVQGIIMAPCTATVILDAERNHWNTRGLTSQGDFPSNTLDYIIYQSSSTCTYPVYLSDANRNPAFSSCSYGPTDDDASTGRIRNCTTCSDLETEHYENIEINAALLDAITYLTLFDPNGDDLDAMERFYEIATASIGSPTAADRYIMELAWELAWVAYGSALKSGQIDPMDSPVNGDTEDAIEFLENLIAARSGANTTDLFLKKLDRAALDYTAFRLDTTLDQLDSLRLTGPTAFGDWLDYASCFVEAQLSVELALISRDEFPAAVAACSTAKMQWDSPLNQNPALSQFHSHDAPPAVRIYPTLTNTQVTVEIENAKQAPEITLADLQGRILLQRTIQANHGGFASLDIDLHGLASGVYMVQVKTGAQPTVQKLIVP